MGVPEEGANRQAGIQRWRSRACKNAGSDEVVDGWCVWMDGVVWPGLGVEEKIQLALAQGDFDNLKGKGKPLQRLAEGRSDTGRKALSCLGFVRCCGGRCAECGCGRESCACCRSGQHFEDRASHMFMDALSKSGMKPVWVERSGRIKQMQAMLTRRLTGQSARQPLSRCFICPPACCRGGDLKPHRRPACM